MSFEDFRQAIVSPALQAIASHWGSARAGQAMPAWEQLKPSRIAAQLPIIWVYKYDRESRQFTGRLAGDRIVHGMGKNFRGTPLQDVHPPQISAWVHDAMSRIVCEPVLYRCEGRLFKHADRFGTGERIALPLAGDGVHGDGVLGASEYQYPYPRTEGQPVELMTEGEQWYPVSRSPSAGDAAHQ